MYVRQSITRAIIGWLLGRSTDVSYSKKQPSKAQYKKKVVLRSSKNIRTNHYQPCRNNYLTSTPHGYYYFVRGID